MSSKTEDKPYDELIQREVKLVLSGKEPDTLIKYLEDLELEPTLPFITQSYANLLCGTYILGKKYQQMYFFIVRNQKKLKVALQIYFEIACHGYEENLKQLILLVKKFAPKSEHAFKNLFEDAVYEYILDKISKNFASYSLAKLKEDYTLTKEWLERKGYEISGNYVRFTSETKQDQTRVQQMLQERMKQIITITDKVISLEK